MAVKGNKYKEGKGKVNEAWVRAFEKVVSEEFNAIYLTDEDLRILTNEAYGKDDFICAKTFWNWKTGDCKNPLVNEILRIYKKALSKQKKQLFTMLRTDKNTWQRWAWIIERKYDEWNIQQKQRINHEVNVKELPQIVIK